LANDGIITEVETYIVVEQRRGICPCCDTAYIGRKEKVVCKSCGKEIITIDVHATLKIPTSQWIYPKGRRRKR
jgi:Zn finger protein HypA/HybF involved in hydrogenase expression